MTKLALFFLLIFEISINAQTDSPDVSPSNISSAHQGEVHVSVNKVYPGNVLISPMTNNLPWPTQVGRFLSTDYGQTWSGTEYSDQTTNYADPTSAFDAQGNAYLIQMTGNVAKTGTSGISIQKCTNPQSTSPTWAAEVPVYLNSSGSCDKEMMACDNLPGSPYANNIYVSYAIVSTRLNFQRSTDGGATFSTPITLGASASRGPHIQTGPSGEVYVVWLPSGEASLGFGRSTNGGSSFSYQTDNAFSLNSITGQNSYFHRAGNIVHNFAYLAVDKGCGPNAHRGRIYVTYPENVLTYPSFKSEIRLRYSDDQGNSWSNAQSINISTALNCYHPYIAVDDATGVVSVAYYSVDDASYDTNVYLAYSTNGGSTFSNLLVSDTSFIPSNTTMAGHYIGNAAYGGLSYPTWYGYNSTGDQKVYISPIKFPTPSYFVSSNDLNIYGPLTVSTVSSSVTYQASQAINAPASGHVMTVPSGANTFLKAAGAITFNPGFLATNGSNLLADIESVTSCMSTTTRYASNENSNSYETNSIETVNGEDKVVIFPNPFYSELTFKYILDNDETVDIRLFDETGAEIAVLLDHQAEAKGIHEIQYNSQHLPIGHYVYVLQAGDKTYRKSLIKLYNKTDGSDEDFEEWEEKD